MLIAIVKKSIISLKFSSSSGVIEYSNSSLMKKELSETNNYDKTTSSVKSKNTFLFQSK